MRPPLPSGYVCRSTFRRSVPSPAIAFSSEMGRKLFGESLAAGHVSSFFELVEQFRTQSEPSLCGPSSLTMVLNALGLDPNQVWKGPWRVYTEEMLKCSRFKQTLPTSSSTLTDKGITFSQLACLARCNGAIAHLTHASLQEPGSLTQLRNDVKLATSLCSNEDPSTHIIASYSRKLLNQTGSGHFSPIGGYHEGSDSVLILDVARFKYPPHWVPLEALHRAMLEIDQETGKSRGWMAISLHVDHKKSGRPLFFLLLNQNQNDWAGLGRFLVEDLPLKISCKFCKGNGATREEVIKKEDFVGMFSSEISSNLILAMSSYVKEYGVNYVTADYEGEVALLLEELRSTTVFKLVSGIVTQMFERRERNDIASGEDLSAEYLSMLFLAIPERQWQKVMHLCSCEDEFIQLVLLKNYQTLPRLQHEIQALRQQMDRLLVDHDACDSVL